MNKLLLLLVFITSSGFAQEKAKTYYSFTADVDGRLIIVPQSDENKYLIYFENFEHQNDGKAKLYKRQWIDNRSQSGYSYRLIGTGREEIVNYGDKTIVFGTKVPKMELKLAGKMPIELIFGENSNLADIRLAEEKYWQYMGLHQSKIETKKRLKKALEKTNSICSSKIKLDIAWSEFESHNQKTVPGFLHSHLKALADICTIDNDYLNAVQSITSIKVQPGDQAVELQNSTMIVRFNRESDNLPDTTYDLIYSVL